MRTRTPSFAVRCAKAIGVAVLPFLLFGIGSSAWAVPVTVTVDCSLAITDDTFAGPRFTNPMPPVLIHCPRFNDNGTLYFVGFVFHRSLIAIVAMNNTGQFSELAAATIYSDLSFGNGDFSAPLPGLFTPHLNASATSDFVTVPGSNAVSPVIAGPTFDQTDQIFLDVTALSAADRAYYVGPGNFDIGVFGYNACQTTSPSIACSGLGNNSVTAGLIYGYVTPEPGTVGLLALGALSLAGLRRRNPANQRRR